MSANPEQALNPCLRAVWQRAQRKHVIGGLLAFARWFVPLFLLTILIDRFAYFPGWLRALAAIAMLVVALRQAWRHGWCRLQGFDATRAARQIEQANGGMDSLLVTAVHFQQHGASPGTSAAMWELTLGKAQQAAAAVEVSKVVSMGDLQRPLRIAAALAAVILIGAVLHGAFLTAGLGRLFTPWLSIAYPTKTKIDAGSGELVVKEGAPATVEIRFSGVIPKTAELALQTGKGRPRELELEVIDGRCTYEIAAASRDFSYRVTAGDARSEWRDVRVIPAPRLAKVKVDLDFPAYIGRAAEQVEALTLTVPEETKVRWQLTLDTPIRKATLHRDGAEDLPLEIGADGLTLTLEESATASRGYNFSWTEDRHGFDFESPRYFLQVASDQAPRVELTKPEGSLSAMLGRPLQLAVRAQDDHGIGSTTIIYRVNRRPEKTVTLETPLKNGEGEQVIDWDYRKEITDLQVGDTVSFVVEVTDKYPGEAGPHRARTDSRRITFLSREDYLAEVTKQMERLLTRVRTLYRQERAAHELVSALDPAADSYLPTCQLEAIRQEMVREQLKLTAGEMHALLEDVAANQVSDAVESNSLATLRDSLTTIAADHVARAADLLRAQVGAKERNPLAAINAVNQAARELSSLVLLRGIDASREVFARETHVIAGDLARLRLRLIRAGSADAESLAADHEQVAVWTKQLLDRLSAGMHYDKRPLAVLGLTRRIQELRNGKVAESIHAAGELAKQGKFAEAASTQYPVIRPLLESEFTMRSGAHYALILDLREQLGQLIAEQQQLLAAGSAADFTQQAAGLSLRQAALRDRLVLAPLPGVSAAHTRLDDLLLPVAPPCDDMRLKVESLMTEAAGHLDAKAADKAAVCQTQSVDLLKQLDRILERLANEVSQKTIGATAEFSDANERANMLEQLENRQVVLIEQTEEAALDNKNPKSLLEDQQAIVDELAAFAKEIAGGDAMPAQSMVPLLGRLEAAGKAAQQALATLKENHLEDALKPQEAAANALGEARALAQAYMSRLAMLQQLIGFERSVDEAASGMDDILDAQKDLIALTKDADEKAMSGLLVTQRLLHTCINEIAPSLNLVAARLDVGTPLAFAASDIEDAMVAMEDNDGEEANDTQTIAVDSLTKVQGLVDAISNQTGYIAEIVERLQQAQADAGMLAHRQRQLREATDPKDAPAAQQALIADATAYGRALTAVAGTVDPAKLTEAVREMFGDAVALDFNAPAAAMQEALKLLQAGSPAAEAMLAAEQSLAAGANQINVIIGMLNGLPGIALDKSSPPEIQRLVKTLEIATKQRRLMREAHGAADKELSALAPAQAKLTKQLGEITRFGEEGLTHPLLDAAHKQLSPVEQALAASRKQEAAGAQVAADQTLRHFIIEQALILNTAIPPTSSSPSDVVVEVETDDLYEADAVGALSDFVSGETPKDKKSEWEFLGTRNRAALNQNFARELPLEFRATLKNYYEKVAK